MNFINEDKISSILFKSMTEDLTRQEKQLLDEWKAESPENIALFEEILSGNQLEDYEKHILRIELSQAKQNIKSRIKARKHRRQLFRIIGAAAAISIGLFTATLLNGVNAGPEEIDITHLPETYNAIITIGESETIYLSGCSEPWEPESLAGENEVAEVRMICIEVPNGSEYTIKLDDGTLVWINSETMLTYPSSFTGDLRKVILKGEAYFEVREDRQRPFVVSTALTDIVVTGTSFNVAAYDSQGSVLTTLVDGKVEINSADNSFALTPGKQAMVDEKTGAISVTNVDTNQYTSWTKGVFEFDDMPLTEICTRLSRWYEVEFIFEGTTGRDRYTGGTWKYVPLADFLKKIERVTNVRFTRQGEAILVSKAS